MFLYLFQFIEIIICMERLNEILTRIDCISFTCYNLGSKGKENEKKDTYRIASFARFDMLAEICLVNPLDDKSLIRIME